MSAVSAQRLVKSVRALALAGLATTTFVAATPAAAEITVVVDRAMVMRVPRPADIVIVGNPAIADATIQDSQTLIITGRSYGTTNLIVLDAAGQAIADEVVIVAAPNEQVVTVYRRALRQTFSCTPECSPTLSIGDHKATFEAVNEQIQAHGALSTQASER